MVTRKENYWRTLINDMKSVPLPEDGNDPPEIEIIKPKSRKKGDELAPSERKVVVQKITTVVYVMSDIDNKKFASVSKQQTSIIGEMTLDDALKLANNSEG